MGQRHIESLKQLEVTLVGIFDSREGAVKEVLGAFDLGAEIGFTDSVSFFERSEMDAVVIATTADSHFDLVNTAIGRGVKKILCEKPLSTSVSQCDVLVERCGASGVQLAINHNRRFSDRFLKVQEFLDRPSFGGLRSVTVVCGNLGLAMNGLHYIEMFHQLSGERIEQVFCQLTAKQTANPRGDQFSDPGGFLHGRTKSGVRFTIEAGADQGHGLQVVYGGRFGQLTVDEGEGWMRWNLRKEENRDMPSTRYYSSADVGESDLEPASVVEPTSEVMKALLEGGNYPTAEDARAAIEVLAAGYFSAENGMRMVSVNDPAIDRERIFKWA